MRLKRVVVKGFKSFADKTEFEFDADLTGIVGPNGCGKSNVVDALKWVLGDQRAKSLRGSEMTDVIFKGAEGRDPMQFAEVTVTLEEESARDDGPFAGRSEVTVGRRLTRDKESSYLLNGEVVRLKDVRDLLMDTGLGVGAYSVMEQGRIDAVLSANPESRRAIFEEAAGISKFKIQKREALRKLERTEQNLARVKDLLEERGRRIRSLKIQAGKARRWNEVHDQLTNLRAATAVVDAMSLRDGERTRSTELREHEERFEVAQERVASARDRLTEVEAAIADTTTQLETAQEGLRGAVSRREAAESRVDALEHRIEELRADAEACVARSAHVERQRSERRTALAEARERLVELENELVELGKETDVRRDAVRETQARVKDLHTRREAAREQLLEEIHARTACRNRAHDQVATLRGVRARTARLDERLEAVEGERSQRDADAVRIARVLDDLGERTSWLDGEEARVLADLELADREAAELARLESGLRERLASATSRLEVLQDMEAHFEGIDHGPRYLLEQAPDGLRGRLLDQVEVDFEHSKALEAALGDFVQALIVETRDDAERLIETLASEGKGRANLLIAEEFGDRLERSSVFSLPEGADFLYKKVRCRAEYWPLVQWLLRGVCLVDDLSQADPTRTDLCFVTRDGTIACGPRLVGGAGDEVQSGLLVRRAQIRKLSEDVEELESRLQELQGDISSVAGRVTESKARVRRVDRMRQSLAARASDAAADRARAESRRDDLVRELVELDLEVRDLRQQELGALSGLGDRLLDELLIRRRETRCKAVEVAVEAELVSARSAAEEASEREQELRVRQASLRSEREAQSHRIDALDQGLRDLDEAVQELDERREQALAGVAEAERESGSRRDEVSAVATEISAMTEARDAIQSELEDRRSERQALHDVVTEEERTRDEVRESVGRLQLEIADVRHRFGRLEEKLRDETRLELRRLLGEVRGLGLVHDDVAGPPTPFDAVEMLAGPPLPSWLVKPHRSLEQLWLDPGFDLEQTRNEVKVLQGQLDRLGSVNLDAVSELEHEEADFSTLEKDMDDLTESRKSLMEALRQMEVESRGLFERTFNQARDNFQEIFRKLFQGGRADMFLTEGDDALESGIEIVARPPGKELQSIALLSGGERSLTALAILFAVFKVKPSPFCILDEVDAALDETNVERFLRVLRLFTGPSQFCIVTHHKRTMAECQRLYGITMQKRGVSTRIGVALDEVDEFSEGPRYEKAKKERIAGEEAIPFEA